jgi:menaquinone-dependent protoporphyrinogen oxidase
MRVLVSAASRYGATAEIAGAIADTLTRRGLEVDALEPAQVHSVEDYDAVVLGSAVYAGHWLEPAKVLAARFRDALAARPVWLFSSGPVGDPRRKLVQRMGADPAELAGTALATGALEHRMFPGKIARGNLTLRQRALLRAFRFEGDFRDWDAVERWADGIAAVLQPVALH